MRAHARLGVVAILAILSFTATNVAAAPSHEGDTVIQPGSRLLTSGGNCTAGFVLGSSAAATPLYYLLTAGHCVMKGEHVTDDQGTVGKVVLRFDEGIDDFALIEVAPARFDDVDPRVRSWGGPAGIAEAGTTAPGDRLNFYGWGVGFNLLETTRARSGLLQSHAADHYTAQLPLSLSDSGAPILHAATGNALGIVADPNPTGLPPSTVIGPTLARILQVARDNGYVLMLARPDLP